jgi:hypothetical protein
LFTEKALVKKGSFILPAFMFILVSLFGFEVRKKGDASSQTVIERFFSYLKYLDLVEGSIYPSYQDHWKFGNVPRLVWRDKLTAKA